MMDVEYQEKVTSWKTSLLFIILAFLFGGIFFWRYSIDGWQRITPVLLVLSCFFGFYVLHYRTLTIQIRPDWIQLQFGIIRWRCAIDNIQEVLDDHSPVIIRYGGAGIHFAFVRKKYYLFFNFLDHPRLLIVLQERRGWIQGVVFSTRFPHQIKQLLTELIHHEESKSSGAI